LTRLAAILLSSALAAGTAALAQPTSNVAQVTDRSDSIEVGTQPATPTTDAPSQISTAAESSPAETQLTSARASHQQTTQLSTEPRTAQAPEGLSRPSEGRTAAVERVEGSDRCDAAVPKDKQTDVCKKVIESRADDYARSQPPELSPEQRLLIDQQWGPGAADVADATRRLAKAGAPDTSDESLGIASIVLQQSQPPAEPDKKDEDPANNAAVQAIIQLVTQTPQN